MGLCDFKQQYFSHFLYKNDHYSGVLHYSLNQVDGRIDIVQKTEKF